MLKDLNEKRLREFIRSCVTEIFSIDNKRDAAGREALKYDIGEYGGILGAISTGKKFSFTNAAHIGFPVIAAYVPRPAGDYTPAYLEDVLEALKGHSEHYYIPPVDMSKYIDDGCNIIANGIDYVLTLESGALDKNVPTHGQRLGHRVRERFGVKQNKNELSQNQEIKMLPIVMQIAPSSSAHVNEFAARLKARLQSRGWKVLDSQLQLEKVKIPEQIGPGVTMPKELQVIPAESLYRAKKYLKPDGTADLEKIELFRAEHQNRSLARWVGRMIAQGKTSVSISSIPAMFRKHIAGWIQRQPDSESAYTEMEPYLMMIVDDNVESGHSMRELGRLAVANTHMQPELLFGATLINIANSKGTTGAPRRGNAEDAAFAAQWAE